MHFKKFIPAVVLCLLSWSVFALAEKAVADKITWEHLIDSSKYCETDRYYVPNIGWLIKTFREAPRWDISMLLVSDPAKEWTNGIVLEVLSDSTDRYKVPGGWVVRVARKYPKDGLSTTFVPDPNYTWVL